LPPLAFHILLHATVSAMDYTPNVVSKRCFFFICIHGLRKVLENFSRGLSPGKVLDFFPVKEWEHWYLILGACSQQWGEKHTTYSLVSVCSSLEPCIELLRQEILLTASQWVLF